MADNDANPAGERENSTSPAGQSSPTPTVETGLELDDSPPSPLPPVSFDAAAMAPTTTAALLAASRERVKQLQLAASLAEEARLVKHSQLRALQDGLEVGGGDISGVSFPSSPSSPQVQAAEAVVVISAVMSLTACGAPPFSGSLDPSVTSRMFCRAAQRYVNDLTPAVKKAFGDAAVVAEIVKRLTGDALLGYNSSFEHGTPSLPDLWEWLGSLQHVDFAYHARRTLSFCKQTQGETIEAFKARFERGIYALADHPAALARPSFLDDRDGLMSVFRMNLNPTYGDKLAEKAPFETTADMFAALRTIWDNKHPVRAPSALNAAAVRVNSSAAVAHSGKCWCCGGAGHTLRDCPKKTSLPPKEWLFNPNPPSTTDF